MDVVEQTIIDFVRKTVGGNPRLSDNLAMVGVDSVGMAELTFELEKRFSIRVDDDVLDLQTIDELAEYIRGKQAATK
jgi:acyl carrier protein